MAEDNQRIMQGKGPLPASDSPEAVTKLPKAFTDWMERNRERAKAWGGYPYFVKDNAKYTKGFAVNVYDKAEKKFTRARKTRPAMDEAVSVLHERYPDIPNTELAAIYHFTRGDVSAFRQLNNQLRKGNLSEFNEAFAELMERGLAKLPPVEAVTYRTIRLNKTELGRFIQTADERGDVSFDGFSSTSLDRRIVEEFAANHKGRKNNETDVILVINGKTGRSIENISQFGTLDNGLPNQRKVLFGMGKTFRVLGCKRIDGEIFGYSFSLEENLK